MGSLAGLLRQLDWIVCEQELALGHLWPQSMQSVADLGSAGKLSRHYFGSHNGTLGRPSETAQCDTSEEGCCDLQPTGASRDVICRRACIKLAAGGL